MAAELDPANTPLREVMSGEPVFLARDRSVQQVFATMREQCVRRIPVVDAEGRLEGVLSLDDLLLLLAGELGDLAEAVRAELKLP